MNTQDRLGLRLGVRDCHDQGAFGLESVVYSGSARGKFLQKSAEGSLASRKEVSLPPPRTIWDRRRSKHEGARSLLNQAVQIHPKKRTVVRGKQKDARRSVSSNEQTWSVVSAPLYAHAVCGADRGNGYR